MLGNSKHNHFHSAAVIVTVVLTAGICGAQDFVAAVPSAQTGTPPIRLTEFSGLPAPSTSTSVTAIRSGHASDPIAAVSAGGDSSVGQLGRSAPRSVTLQQVQQQSANRLASALASMSHFSVEAA